MIVMLRPLVVATLLSVIPLVPAMQQPSVLHISVVLVDAERKATPVPRLVLLVSDNPSSAPPRRIVTKLDGTADVQLRPGNYTIESDQPVVFHGKAYQWSQTVDVAAGRDGSLALTADNAETVTASTPAGTPALEADPLSLLLQWQGSVIGIWTPTTHASGVLVDANGLITTNQRAVGGATTVEAQITASLKVTARVLVADATRDVAVLWIDPKAVASLLPLPLECARTDRPRVVKGQSISTIGAPLLQPIGTTSGTANRVDTHSIDTDLDLATGSTGGPVFGGGGLVGITSAMDPQDDTDTSWRVDARVVPIDDVCAVVAAAEQKMKDASPPSGDPLPLEPERPFPADVLKGAAQRGAGSLNPYQMSSSDFDITFITPIHTYAAQSQADASWRRGRGGSPATADAPFVRPLMEFGSWSKYVAEFPPVVLVRVTPRLVEGFWTKVARGAAYTQGVGLPPMKRLKSGFSRMRTYCGDAEVTPIHPFTIEHRVSDDTIDEGLYVFDPGALGPSCNGVRIVLYSEKEPARGDTRVVDPKIIQQVWEAFAPYRALK
jgi:hypothetical protein